MRMSGNHRQDSDLVFLREFGMDMVINLCDLRYTQVWGRCIQFIGGSRHSSITCQTGVHAAFWRLAGEPFF